MDWTIDCTVFDPAGPPRTLLGVAHHDHGAIVEGDATRYWKHR